MTKYILLIGGTIIAGMALIIYIGMVRLDAAQAQVAAMQERLIAAEQAIKQQEEIIDDLDRQNEIIINRFNILQDEVNKIEEDFIERLAETEQALQEADVQESEEAAETLTNNLNSILNRLEGSTR